MFPSNNSEYSSRSESAAGIPQSALTPSTSASASPRAFSVTSDPSSSAILQRQRLIHPINEIQSEFYHQTLQQDTPPETFEVPTTFTMYPGRPIPAQTVSVTEIMQMLESLRTRRINTLTEIRRIEKVLSSLPQFSVEYCSTVTDAWNHYVNSNNFLNELRTLTRQYPFSSELLAEAKVRVIHDPNSSRSWNFAWLLLCTMRSGYIPQAEWHGIPVDQSVRRSTMISDQATRTSQSSAMWGGYVPDQENAAELAAVLTTEWTRAVDQLLRHWPVPPTFTGTY